MVYLDSRALGAPQAGNGMQLSKPHKPNVILYGSRDKKILFSIKLLSTY